MINNKNDIIKEKNNDLIRIFQFFYLSLHDVSYCIMQWKTQIIN